MKCRCLWVTRIFSFVLEGTGEGDMLVKSTCMNILYMSWVFLTLLHIV